MNSTDLTTLHAAGLAVTADGRICCAWQSAMPAYHDSEWGRVVVDDIMLYEKVCLEGFLSGMSWKMIYNKRDNFRRAFAGFDFRLVARFGEDDIARLMADKSIVRNRAKIVSAINNAQRALALVEEAGSLAAWFWQFEPAPERRPAKIDLPFWQTVKTCAEAEAMSKALKKRGWTWVGPVATYSLMQALGLVNDHLEGCCCRAECEAERARLIRPR